MFVYVILYFFIILVSMNWDRKNTLCKREEILLLDSHILHINKKSLRFFLIIFVPLWLVMGLRYNIGADFRNYQAIFDAANNTGTNKYNVEIGFYWLNKLVALFSDNSQSIFIIVAFFMILFFLRGFMFNSDVIFIQLVVFLGTGYYFYAMNIMRQYLAISIMCYAYHYLEKKQYKKWLLFLIIAFLFHKSVLIWIPVYLLIIYTESHFFYLFTLLFAVIFKYGYRYILKILLRFIPYAHYFLSEDSFVTQRMSWSNVVVTGMVLLVYIIFGKELIAKRKNNSQRIKYIWIMFLAYLFLNSFGDSIIRLVLHFFFLIPALLADFFECFTEKTNVVLKVLFAVAMGSLMVYLLNYSGNINNHFIPYVTAFN